MRIEIRNDSVLLDGYVNAIARDSRPMLDENGEKFVEEDEPRNDRAFARKGKTKK
ncbi:phage capsid and scaffold [Clostridium sp. CAG:557]|nr:phage capsid and scaffold [Clostridium sp. CAG:557]